jgi:hypothetical protein
MPKRLMAVAAVAFLTLLAGALAVARPASQEMHNLKRAHKQQWKSLKEQERAEKDALERHPQTPESRKRFEHDMKAQQRLVTQVQKGEIRGLKESQRAAKGQAGHTKRTEARVMRGGP